MVLLKDVQGRLYNFKSNSERLDLSMPTPDITAIVRRHKVLVLDIVRGKLDYVKVMTITSTLKDDGEYVPIAPVPKKGFPVQLQLRNYDVLYRGDLVLSISRLPKRSYLKINSYDEVPIQSLVNAIDNFGNPFMVCLKRKGGLGELRDYVRRRDVIREQEKLHRITEKQGEEEDGV